MSTATASAYARLYNVLARDRARSKTDYDLGEEHRQLAYELRKEINAAWTAGDVLLDVPFFTDAILAVPGARYVKLNLQRPDAHGPDATPTIPMTLVAIGRDIDTNALIAIDESTGETLGPIGKGSFRHAWRDEDDTSFRLYDSLSERSLLPLEGPVLAHPTVARVAKLARKLSCGDARIARIRKIASELKVVRASYDEIKADAMREAETHLGDRRADLEAANAALVADMDGMDWTYDYADRPNRAYGEQEMRIRAALAGLPLDDAAALFVLHAKYSWTSFACYLQRHPEILKAAA